MPPRQRLQVSGVEAERLRPSATPIDTFAPDRAAGSGLSQLAGALSRVAPELSRFAQQELEQDQQEAQLEGKAQAQRRFEELKADAEGFRKAVRKGDIPEWESPWFRLGFFEMSGRMLADSYGAELTAAMTETLEDEGVTDPSEFDRITQEVKESFLEQHLGEGSIETALRGSFARTASALEGGLRRQFAAQAGANMVEATFDNIYSLTTSTLQQDPPVEEVVSTLEREMDRGYQTGLDPSRLNQTVADAILNEAVRTGDSTKLSLLSRIRTNKASGARLSGIRDVGTRIAQARSDIRAENTAQRQEEIRVREDAVRVARLDLGDAIEERIRDAQESGENIRSLQFDDLRRQYTLRGVENADEVIRELSEAFLGTQDNEEEAIRLTTLDIWDDTRLDDPVGLEAVRGLLRDQRINQGGYDYLVNQINLRDAAFGLGPGEEGAANAVRDPVFSYHMTGFAQTYEALIGNIPGQPGAGEVINQGRSTIHQRWSQAYQGGAGDLSETQRGELASAIIGQVVEEMSESGELGTFGTADDPRPEAYWTRMGATMPEDVFQELESYIQNGGEPSDALVRTLLLSGLGSSPSDARLTEFYNSALQGR